jgi:ubiquinone/menaquinone biosynthesis C-methylase UbiE
MQNTASPQLYLEAEHSAKYRSSISEQARQESLVRLMGEGESAIDVGTLDGHYSRVLARRYTRVVALDLIKPEIPGVECVQGNIYELQFPDRSFDLVLCTEVLEHLTEPERAARELMRVARRRLVIGVPYKQDLRFRRITCRECGKPAPAWGHINRFDEKRLTEMFQPLKVHTMELVGKWKTATTDLATWLMDRGGNPYGPYDQRTPCFHCGARYRRSENRTLIQRAFGLSAAILNKTQHALTKPHAVWIHIAFEVTDKPRDLCLGGESGHSA